MDLAICRQFIYAAFHSLEQRFERFRQGAAARVPDLTDFRHKVAEFLAKFSWNKPEPTITVTQPSRAPASLQPDPTLEGLEKPFFMRREEMFDEELVPEPTLDSVEITHEALDEGGHRIATDASEAATNFVKTLKEAVAEAGEAATKFVEAAKGSLSNTIDGFMGSPPPPPPPPPPAAIVPTTISGEHREELEESIASQPDMHWVGQRKSEQTRHALEHPQPKIIDPEISPQREGTFFEPKEVREPLAEQKPAVEKMTNRPEESVTLSDADLKEAAKLVRDAALRAEADAYKEQEAMFATQNPVASSAGVAIEPAAEPDPTEAEAFRHWGSPGNPMSETERTAVRPPQARHKDETRRRELEALEREVKQQWDDLRSAEQGRKAWEQRFSEEFNGSSKKPAAPRRRQPSSVQTASEKPKMAEGIPSSGDWPKRHPPRPLPIKIEPKLRRILRQPGAGARPDSAVKVRFKKEISDEKTYDDRSSSLKQTTSRRVTSDMEERARATDELRRLHRKAKRVPTQPLIDTDRFLDLMTIAQDKGPADAHRLAIQLYRRYQSQSASGDWTKDAERTLRAQLQGLSKTDALNALEPVIAHFDRYKVLEDRTEVFKDNTEREYFSALIQLSAILHRTRRDVMVGDLTPPGSRTSS